MTSMDGLQLGKILPDSSLLISREKVTGLALKVVDSVSSHELATHVRRSDRKQKREDASCSQCQDIS